MMPADTLRAWLRSEILSVLKRNVSPPPLVLWCDPDRAWRDLLKAAADGDAFELWAEEEHELVLRERLQTLAPKPRVVWLPVYKDYMELGSFSRGSAKGTIQGEAGFVFNGNLHGDVETIARTSHLFLPFPGLCYLAG